MTGGLPGRGGLRALACLLVTLAGLRAWGQQATLLGDAHVSSERPTVNSGSLSNLNVGGGYTALVQFDLGTLPVGTTGAQITRATLRVYCNRADTPGVISVQAVGAGWSESSVTYATLPALGPVVQTAAVVSLEEFVTFDVTSTVQGWVNAPATNYGLALTAGSAVVQFDSKENDQTAHAAQLEIALAAGGSGTAGAAGATGASGPTGATGMQGIAGGNGVAGPVGATGGAGVAGVAGATGLVGATGPAGSSYGVQGATGATGAAGASGAAGVNGAAGVTGAPGSPGLVYQGTYSSTTNYALGDVVVFAGASYASLLAANHGNTPGLSPADWGLLAQVGAAGSTGLAGSTGVAGLQGATGVGAQGATGAGGLAGVTGATGSAGLAYQGTYSSTTNYALGDVVVFAGSSYASLLAANHGNTPGLSPADWGLLTAQGPVGLTGGLGATGATGSQGVPGSVGPAGQQGSQGVQGVGGQAGAQGIPGVVGATGLQGLLGPQGLVGPVGLSFQGAYTSTTNYALGNGVSWEGAGWVSLIDNNHGNTPDQSPAEWAMFAASGAVGAVGAAGATGATGVAGSNGVPGVVGASGATGAAGSTGAAGLAYQGAYSSATNYALGDVVVYGGSSYASLTPANHGNTPSSSPGDWGLLTAQGAVGPAGATGGTGGTGIQGVAGVQGTQGVAGVQGPAGTQGPAGAQGLTGANGAQGPVGAAGPQGTAGQAGAQGLPGVMGATGPQGVAGIQGLVGATGLSFQGAYSSTANYALGDGVLWLGAGWVSLVAGNHGNAPDQSPLQWAMFAAQGGVGVAGATGAVGPTGAMGVAGSQGLVGAAGSTGATGSQGAAGLNFTGVYSAATSYGVSDAVSYGGSSYVSLVGGNHGQTPGLSAAYWAVLAAQGGSGATGVAGPAGSAGATGTAGAVGATGAQGTPVSYGGAWLTTQAYAVGAAVSYGGGSYIAMVANSGREPDVSPSYWGLLAASGSIGATGAVGATGFEGPMGFPGATGAQGVSGSQGVAGPVGATGSVGATGPIGSAGPSGATGAAGLVYVGTYSPGTNYGAGAVVSYGGSSYVSLATGNAGQTPGPLSAYWAVLAAAGSGGAEGATGASGATGVGGAAGLAGATGAAGTNGASGATGSTGLTWQGAWLSGTNYAANAGVSYGGSSYISLVGNMGQNPVLTSGYWAVLSASGATGANGVAGSTGVQGASGLQGASGTAGSAGATGSTGAVGMNFRGAWAAATNYAVDDAVTFDGASYLAETAGTNKEPDLYAQAWTVIAQAGGVGPTGAGGSAATVSVGTVTTLAAGSAATVSNGGTAQAAVLNFGIPEGVAGAAGASGSSGSTVTGNAYAAMYHAVSFSTLYYAVNSSNASATETAAVLAWVPLGCTVSQMNVYSQQSGALTVTLRSGTPGNMANTAIACSPATNGSCVATGSVAIPAGDFIDFSFAGASGTVAGVWTSLQCQ